MSEVFNDVDVALEATHSFRQRSGFSISSIGNCLAQQLFNIAGFPQGNPPNARTLRTWRLGNIIEQEIYDLLAMAGYTVVGKQKAMFGEAPPREGHIDGFILKHTDDGPMLFNFDAKSANARSFDEWIGHAFFKKWPTFATGLASFDPRYDVEDHSYRPVLRYSPTYYYQAQGYLDLINSREEYGAYRIDNIADVSDELRAAAIDGAIPISKDGFYFYVYCKDDSRLYEEYVPYDKEVTDARLKVLDLGLRTVREAADESDIANAIRQFKEVEKVAPKKGGTEPELHWKCKRCPFVAICWKEEAENG